MSSTNSLSISPMDAMNLLTKKQKYLCFGYVRRIQQQHKELIIPSDIISMIAIFYRPLDEWNNELKSKLIL